MPSRVLLFAAALALTTLAAACDDNDTNGELTVLGTPTVPATVEAVSPTATPTPVRGIREEDLSALPALQDFMAENAGELDETEVIYADLTNDGTEEAVVPVSSGGTLGNLAVFVFGYGPDGLQAMLQATPEASQSGIRASVEAGRLVTIEEVHGPDDPLCCPTQLKQKTYIWDGNALILDNEELTPS